MKKIIFDLDNTLLFISNDWADYYLKTFNKYQLDINPEEVYNSILEFESSHIDTIVSMQDIVDYMQGTLSLPVNEEILNDLWENFSETPLLYTDKIRNLLSYLAKKYELVAYSNQFVHTQTKRLKRYNLDQYFSKIYGWDIIPSKPSKKGIEEIIKGANKKDIIFVGDSIKYDLELSNYMGLSTIFYNRKGIKQNKYKEIIDIEELKNIL